VISAPKIVLVVDDEPAVRWLLQQGLPPHLPEFAIATASNGQEAIDYLSSKPVEVVVTDITMPVKDGFELLAYVRNHHPNLPVVVLASAAPESIVERAPRLGAMRVLKKPAPPDLVARHVLEARSETARGRMAGVPLATLLQLMQIERKTCSLLVSSGTRRGRLHFLSGELVNAYAFELDSEGEAAARHLLMLDQVTIDFERSLHNHVRRVHTPLSTLLLEVAAQVDEANRAADGLERSTAARVATRAPGGILASTEDDAPSASSPPLGPPRTLRLSPEPASQPGGSEVVTIDAALGDLHEAIGGLRARSAAIATLLDAATIDLTRCGASLSRSDRMLASDFDEQRVVLAWSEVANLAARLVQVTDAPDSPTTTVGT
jgi:CheY-like chemotaxis protein